MSKYKNRGKPYFVKFEARLAGFMAYERLCFYKRFVYAPGERNQITPVNRYTTGGFRWVLDFGLILTGYVFEIIYMSLLVLLGGSGGGPKMPNLDS